MVVFDKDIVEDPAQDIDRVSIPNAEREGPIVELMNAKLLEDKGGSYHQKDPRAGHWSAANGCKRRSYLNYVHKLDDDLEEIKNDASSYWTFTHGDLIHEFIQDMFVEALGEEHVTVEEWIGEDITDEYTIAGHADLVIRGHEKFPDPFVIDIKTKSEFTYYNYGKGGHVRSIPSESNMMQLNGYMHHVGAKFGALLYYSKRNDHIEEYWIEQDDELFEEGIGNIVELLDHVQQGEPAPKDAKEYLCCNDYCKYYRKGMCDGVEGVDPPENYEEQDFSYEEGRWD